MRRRMLIHVPIMVVVLLLTASAGCDLLPAPATATPAPATWTPRPTFTAVGLTPSPTTLAQTPVGPTVTPSPRPPATGTAPASAYPATQGPATPTIPPSPTPTPTPEPLNLADQPPMTIRDWPRPTGDNGRGMHFLIHPYFMEDDLDKQVARLQYLNVKWTLALFADENQLAKAGTRFKAAGIYVVWRKSHRPAQRIYGLAEDVHYLQRLGLPPYMQIYNEPSLAAEWEGKIDKATYLENFALAARDVYNAGGYVGLQQVDEAWLVDTLRYLKMRKGEAIFQRMFFIPHPYALNHPPNYTQDVNGVLGFQFYARIFEQEIGFVPPMIAGEGGWKYNSDADARYPNVDDTLHRDYHVELFNWFRTGRLSTGDPLPDYLLAFCPWLLSEKLDDNAWYDSFAGDRTLTIEAVHAIPPFTRKFSWER